MKTSSFGPLANMLYRYFVWTKGKSDFQISTTKIQTDHSMVISYNDLKVFCLFNIPWYFIKKKIRPVYRYSIKPYLCIETY